MLRLFGILQKRNSKCLTFTWISEIEVCFGVKKRADVECFDFSNLLVEFSVQQNYHDEYHVTKLIGFNLN